MNICHKKTIVKTHAAFIISLLKFISFYFVRQRVNSNEVFDKIVFCQIWGYQPLRLGDRKSQPQASHSLSYDLTDSEISIFPCNSTEINIRG